MGSLARGMVVLWTFSLVIDVRLTVNMHFKTLLHTGRAVLSDLHPQGYTFIGSVHSGCTSVRHTYYKGNFAPFLHRSKFNNILIFVTGLKGKNCICCILCLYGVLCFF